MDATERTLIGAAILLVVFAVTLMTGYVAPPDPSPDILRLAPGFMQVALPKSRTITEQDVVVGMALEGLSSRR